MTQTSKTPWWKTTEAKVTLAGSIVAGIVTVIVSVLLSWLPSDDSTEVQAGGTATTVPPASSRSTPSPVEQNGINVQYLADIEPVSGDPRTDPSTIGGNKVECLRSARFPINSFNSKYTAVYNIDPSWTTFHAVLGLDNVTKSGTEAHFQIYADDVPVDTGHLLNFFSTKEVNIDVTGKSRLTLVTEGVKFGGVGNSGVATWCDARFTK